MSIPLMPITTLTGDADRRRGRDDNDDSFVVTAFNVLPLTLKILGLSVLTAVTSTQGDRYATGLGNLLAL